MCSSWSGRSCGKASACQGEESRQARFELLQKYLENKPNPFGAQIRAARM
jgi:hypothetical protein